MLLFLQRKTNVPFQGVIEQWQQGSAPPPGSAAGGDCGKGGTSTDGAAAASPTAHGRVLQESTATPAAHGFAPIGLGLQESATTPTAALPDLRCIAMVGGWFK